MSIHTYGHAERAMDDALSALDEKRVADLPKTRVEAVLLRWRAHPQQLITYSEAEGAYCGPVANASALDRHSRNYVGMTLTRLLKRYGSKTGKAGDRSPWKYGFPTVSPAPRTGGRPKCWGCRRLVNTLLDHGISCPYKLQFEQRRCDHCGHYADRHSDDCMLAASLRQTTLDALPPIEKLRAESETGPIRAPSWPPHLTEKPQSVVEAEATLEHTRQLMLNIQRRYSEQEATLRQLVTRERWMVWARQQVSTVDDKTALEALSMAADEKRRGE